MIDDLRINTLGRDVKQIHCEVESLEAAMLGPAGMDEVATAARRVEASARVLRRRLDEESVLLWLLLQDPARRRQADQIHGWSRRTLVLLLSLLDRDRRRSWDRDLQDPWSDLVLLSDALAEATRVVLLRRS